MQIAVVGCGAAGLYTAKKLLEKLPGIKIAFFESQLLPFGLVRTGIAPDHPELRTLRAKFAETILDNRTFYFGSGYSFDWSVASRFFNGVIDARGGSVPNRLEVLNYECRNVIDSQDMVEWILGLKKSSEYDEIISTAQIISILGLGNVSLDVARFLISRPGNYTNLEIGDEAIRFLHFKKVSKASFGLKELRETVERAESIGIGAQRLGTREGHSSKIYDMIETYSLKSNSNATGLEFAFDHTPIEAINDNGKCTHLIFRTSIGETLKYPTDLVISCTGYKNQQSDLVADVPIHKVGWIAHNCRGALADSMIDSQGALKFVKSLNTTPVLGKLEELTTVDYKKKLANIWLYENAMSSLLRRPWSYPGSSRPENELTHQFLEKLTRY